jgi:hypothetical protein
MPTCSICTLKVKTIEPVWSSCSECYQTGRAISKANDISMSRALIRLGEEIRKNIELGQKHVADAERKVLKPKGRPAKPTDSFQASEDHLVNIKKVVHMGNISQHYGQEWQTKEGNVKVTKHINEELYRELEYEFLDLDGEPDFGSVDQQIFHYRQLLDIALLGGDIEWARKLNKQIQRAKGITQ